MKICFGAMASARGSFDADVLLEKMTSVKLQRSGAAWEATENPKVTRYYDTDDDDDFIEVEEIELDAEELAAMRAPYWARRSPFDPFEEHHRRGRAADERALALAPPPRRLVLDANPLRCRRLAGRSRSRSRSRDREECCMSDDDGDLSRWAQPKDEPSPNRHRTTSGPAPRAEDGAGLAAAFAALRGALAPPRAEDDGSAAQGPRLRRANTH